MIEASQRSWLKEELPDKEFNFQIHIYNKFVIPLVPIGKTKSSFEIL